MGGKVYYKIIGKHTGSKNLLHSIGKIMNYSILSIGLKEIYILLLSVVPWVYMGPPLILFGILIWLVLLARYAHMAYKLSLLSSAETRISYLINRQESELSPPYPYY